MFTQNIQWQALNFEDKRREVGITDDLVRLSLGIEDGENLIEELKQALE